MMIKIFQNISVTKGNSFSANILTQVIFLFAKWKKIKPQVKLKEDSSKGYLTNYYVN